MEEQENIIDSTYRGNIWCTPQERLDWRVYITELGDDPKNHIEAVDMIRVAGEEDVVEILLTSPGGRCDIADMYVSAIADSKAKIITRAIGECMSAATTIFLAGDERICDDGAYFMFHNVQFGLGGDSAAVFARSKFYDRLFKEKYYKEMSEVLTKEELDELFDRAGEVYLTAGEMRERLQKADTPAPEVVVGEWGGQKGVVMKFADGGLMGHGVTINREARGDMSPKEWWDMVQGKEVRIPAEAVSMPFPETKVKSAEEFPQGDEFEINLSDGYRKVFRLSLLCEKDFDEYNMQEIEEVGECFGIGFAGMSRSQAIEALIDEIQNGEAES